MKTPQTIDLKHESWPPSRETSMLILILSLATLMLSLVLSMFNWLNANATLITAGAALLMTLVAIYLISIASPKHYIYLNHEEILFKRDKDSEEVCLKFDGLAYFETRFSEIVFSTKEAEKFVLPLNYISNEKKRWQIKEYLREHLTQRKQNAFAFE
ncbi:hypothetical protein [Pelobium manganitolerans]|uniref:hypothetical protein n=1 Tax=Pelobium manganitolerans TaxID=1842495 RepID=UPI003FA378A1